MDSYKKLFSYLDEPAPSPQLFEAIAKRIQVVKQNALRLRFFLFGTGAILSFGALVPVAQVLLEKVSTTGFYQYLTLALSGDGEVYMFWKELLWSLVETAPLMSLFFVLCVSLVLLWSVSQTVTTARRLAAA